MIEFPLRKFVLVLLIAGLLVVLAGNGVAAEGMWRQRGFEDFRQGKFGNSGQNLYVSRAGVLQRIFQFDLNRDGFLDLVFCNSHGKLEHPPAFVYPDPLREPDNRIELTSDGPVSGAVADLNADGYDDLVLAMADNGTRSDLSSYIYYGSPERFSERRLLLLPAPRCISAATGDFNADGKLDVAFLLGSKVRIFQQDELGFEPKRFKDLEIAGVDIAADDLDGQAGTDLAVRTESGEINIHWGGKRGLDANVVTTLEALGPAPEPPAKTGIGTYPGFVDEARPIVKVIRLRDTPYVFAPDRTRVHLVPVQAGRDFGSPIRLECKKALSVAAGDIDGDGHNDIAVSCRDQSDDEKTSINEQSWIYWGSKSGTFSDADRTPLASRRACDVVTADIDVDGCDEVVLCQYYEDDSYSTISRVYRGSRDRQFTDPVELGSDDARRVLVVRPREKGDTPQLVFVNRVSGDRLGNPDASIYWGGAEGFDAKRGTGVAAWGAVESILADLNDDGMADLAIANGAEDSILRDPGSYVYLNRPQGLAHEPTLRLPAKRSCAITCGDINHDGHLDLVCGGFSNPELSIFLGTGPGSWNTEKPTRIQLVFDGKVQPEPRWLYLADFNDDSWLDLVVPLIEHDRSAIMWGSAAGFSTDRCQLLPVFQAACAHAADFAGTGRLDLVFGGYKTTLGGPHDSFAYLFWNGPDGFRQDHSSQLPAAGACSMAVADFNNDETLDLFVGSYHASVDRDTDSFIYWNRKDRGFSLRDRARLFTHSASGAVASDFNEDGWTDLAVAYHKIEGDHRGWSAVWWNGPDGFNQNRMKKLPTTGPHGMTAVPPSNQRDRGPEEFYESTAFELPAGARPTSISWEADVPKKTWLKAQVRVAESREALENAAWAGPAGPKTWFSMPQPIPVTATGRWLQYRLALGATNAVASPRVREVSIEYDE
jgi:hypothetical protein